MVRYPHVLEFSTASLVQDYYDAATSKWIQAPKEITMQQIKCRVTPNDRQSTIVRGEDGQQTVFSWTIYVPVDCPEIPLGTQVSVLYDGQKVASGTVKEFLPVRQMHKRIRL